MVPVLRRRRLQERLVDELRWRRVCSHPLELLKLIQVEDKTSASGFSPFVPTEEQVLVMEALLSERQVVLLKARQLGHTTVCVAFALWLMVTRPGTTVLMVSKDKDAANAAIERMKTMISSFPVWLRVRIPVPNDNKEDVTFSFGLGRVSRIRSVASNPKAGAGYTADLVLLDEAALHDELASTLQAVKPTVQAAQKSPRPGAVLVMLSTSRGRTDLFAQTWLGSPDFGAPKPARWNGFVRLFFPWWTAPKGVFGEAEYEAARTYYEDMGTPWVLFREHPASPEEAFRESAARFFEVLPGEELLDDEVWVRGRFLRSENGLRFIPEDGGPVWMHEAWLQGSDGQRVVIGADVASGSEGQVDLVPGASGGRLDASAAVAGAVGPDGVLDLRAFVWSKGLEPRRYARVLADLGRWFEDLDGRPALLAPEINSGWGAEVVSELTSVEVNYWNLYRWTRATSVSGRASGDYGWQTNRRTRPALLAAMSRWMAPVGEDPVEFRVRNFWRPLVGEMETFVRREVKGRATEDVAADSGCHDDIVMAFGIMCAVWQELRVPAPDVDAGTVDSSDEVLGVPVGQIDMAALRREGEVERARLAREGRGLLRDLRRNRRNRNRMLR